MKQLLILALLVQACAVREPFRPRHHARDMIEQQLDCDDVEIARAPDNPYRRDPLPGRAQRWVAWGCGRVARLECDPFGSRNGSCRDDRSYEAPPENAAQGIVKIEAHYHSTEGIAQRETYRVQGHGEIVRRRDPGAFAFPVEAGTQYLSVGSAPVIQQIRHHNWTSLGTEYRNGRSYTVTRYHHSTSVRRYAERGCNRSFPIHIEPNASYRVLFEYHGPDRCEVTCAREVQTPGGTALISCGSN